MKLHIEDLNTNEIDIVSENELHDYVEEMLQNYYEVTSDYGNPIHDLMRYITDTDKLIQILEEFNYGVRIER